MDDKSTIMPDKSSANTFIETPNHCHSSVEVSMAMENGGILVFLGTQVLKKSVQVQTKLYVKPTNTGLLLHYKSSIDDSYKRGI